MIIAGNNLNKMIIAAQKVIQDYIIPDSGISEHTALGELIGIFDCSNQHEVQRKWKEVAGELSDL